MFVFKWTINLFPVFDSNEEANKGVQKESSIMN